jgi:hypothetical protein
LLAGADHGWLSILAKVAGVTKVGGVIGSFRIGASCPRIGTPAASGESGEKIML